MRRHALAAVAVACLVSGCGGGGDSRRASSTPTATPAATVGGDVTYCAGRFVTRFERTTVRRFNQKFRRDGMRARFRELAGDITTRRGYLRFLRAVDRQIGRDCDVLLVPAELIGALASGGALLDLSTYVQSRRDEFVGRTLDTARYDDRYWGVPRAIGAALLYYRVDSGAPPFTWQEAYATARREGGLVYAGGPGPRLTIHFLELAYAAGGRVLSNDLRSSEFDSPQNLRALEFMRRGITSGAVPRAVTRMSTAQAIDAYVAGRPAYLREWAYTLDDRSPDFDATELPAFGNGEPASVLDGYDVVVADRPRSERAAMAFVNFVTGEDEVELALSRKGIAPALEISWAEPAAFSDMAFGLELERSIKQARPLPVTAAWPAISDIISSNVHAALTGRTTPSAALGAADRQIERALTAGPRPGLES
jgi:multiple sugar transport system substrate-binding protein